MPACCRRSVGGSGRLWRPAICHKSSPFMTWIFPTITLASISFSTFGQYPKVAISIVAFTIKSVCGWHVFTNSRGDFGDLWLNNSSLHCPWMLVAFIRQDRKLNLSLHAGSWTGGTFWTAAINSTIFLTQNRHELYILIWSFHDELGPTED